MNPTSSGREPLEKLAEEFADRLRRGERPTLAEYTARYPHLADQIRDLFPALAALEDLGSVGSGPAEPAQAMPVPTRLGDYRLLRMIGKGGMGVVYEAVQESLARHVALKVLPPHACHNPMYLERFRREAKAAARLHHSNIVPVFGTGEAGGVHFYAMQFINGHTLDVVAAEVRRLRERPPVPVPLPATVAMPAAGVDESGSTPHWPFEATPAPAEPLAGPSTVAPLDTAGGPSSLSGQSEGEYFRSVARIGANVAEALDFAHRQGVLHRDVKPSNLILDAAGAVWVADFGLAKADDAADLTGTGDIVGTLRFMAPERFRGVSDRRGDVYGLGVTLYELVTLRPSFDEPDKLRLIERVRTESPDPPRQVNGHIPRDLETIILKAMAKEPGHRYQTAAALADDLNRFLAGRPIAARPVGAVEQAWRWCRRNQAVAGLLGGVFTALAAGLTASLILWRQAEANLTTATQQRARANGAVDVAQDAVDGLLAEVGADKLKNIREMDPVRRELLNQATRFYEELLKLSGHDPEVRRRAGRAYARAGAVSGQLGQPAEAEAAFVRAVALQTALVDEFPADDRHRDDLGYTYSEYGTYRRRADKSGEEFLAKARDLFADLLARHPGENRYRDGLLVTLNNLAVVYSESNRFGPAEETYTEAVRLWQEQAAARPDDLAARQGLAVVWHNLGRLYRNTGRVQPADDAFRHAVEEQRKVVARSAAASDRALLAHYLANQGWHFYWTGRADRVEPIQAEALKLADQVVAEHPAVPLYKWTAGFAGRGLGLVYQNTNRPAEAEAAFERAVRLLAEIATPDSNPDFQEELGWAYQNQGYLAQGQAKTPDQMAEAEQFYRKALAAWEPLLTGPAFTPRYLTGPGQVCHNLGMIAASKPGGWAAAAEHYTKAIEYRERLNGLTPDNPVYLTDLAWTHNNIGRAYRAGKRPADAARHFARAAEIRDRLANQASGDADARFELSNTLYTLGLCEFDQGRAEKGLEVWSRALAAREEAARIAPKDLAFAAWLGGVNCDLGVKLAEAGRPAEAVDRFNRAVEVLEGVVKQDEKQPQGRPFLANALAGRGRVHSRAGRHPEARADFDRGVHLAAGAQQTWAKLERACGLARAGDHAGAASEVVAAIGKEPKAADLVTAARACSLAATAAKAEPELATTYRQRAVTLLKEAIAAGSSGVAGLAADPEFAPLRGEEEFESLARPK